MKLLTLNGVEFPLVQCDGEPVRAGDVERSATLEVRDGVRAQAEDLKCAVQLLDAPLARAVRGLVAGEGFTVPFTSVLTPTSFLWSSRGQVPGLPDFDQVAGGRFGGTCASNPGGNEIVYRVRYAAQWTALVWVADRDGPPKWHHVVWRTDGAAWRDGVLQPDGDDSGWVATYDLGDGDMSVRLGDYSGGGDRYSSFVWLPFLVPNEWVSSFYAFHSAHEWPSLPSVLAEGAAVGGGSALVQGRVGGVVRSVGGAAGTWRESFAFDLLCAP